MRIISIAVTILLMHQSCRCQCTHLSITRKLLLTDDDIKQFRRGQYGYKKNEFFHHDYRESELQKCEASRTTTSTITTAAMTMTTTAAATTTTAETMMKTPAVMVAPIVANPTLSTTLPSSSSLLSPLSAASSSRHLEVCSEACTNVADTSGATIDFERTTATGKDTVEVVQEALRHAWRQWDKRARQIDLFVRTGCRGAAEARFLFESVELFWPRGIGHVVVVLDEGDAAIAEESILPAQTKHSYRVFFERAPCMPGRVFNQVSYLMADHYSSADTIVTIDSDCVFHSPVTPDLLFDERGSILLPWSAKFQEGFWNNAVEYFTGPGTYLGHSMVSQPVTVHRSTLQAYRRWYAEEHGGRCLLDGVSSFVDEVSVAMAMITYCWMCQINAFIQSTGATVNAYKLIDIESSASRPYQRFSLHVNYESVDGVIGDKSIAEFKKSADAAVQQGLCRALGSRFHGNCLGSEVSYVKNHLFSYAGWFWKLDELQRLLTEIKYVEGIRKSLLGTGNRRKQS